MPPTNHMGWMQMTTPLFIHWFDFHEASNYCHCNSWITTRYDFSVVAFCNSI